MLIEFAPGRLKGVVHATAGGHGAHYLSYRYFRGPPVISRHVVTNVALGHYSNQTPALLVFYDRCATASSLAHRQCGMP
jgi:hypothetical protein